MDDQKRWIQKASLRPGHHSDPRPRPPPSASNDGTSGETPATLPGPSLRRGPAHGPVLPLAEVKPGARELGRWKSFRVRPFSREGTLRDSCRCLVAWSRPLFPRSFPGLPPFPRHPAPGRRNRPKDRNAGPGTMLQALSFPDARGKGFLEAPQGARAALYWGSILAPLTPRKRGKHGNQGKPRKARKST